jgi:hypothetical protein
MIRFPTVRAGNIAEIKLDRLRITVPRGSLYYPILLQSVVTSSGVSKKAARAVLVCKAHTIHCHL